MRHLCFTLVLLLSATLLYAQPRLFAFAYHLHWGFMDESHHIIVNPMYACASDFTEGLACVADSADGTAQYGFINNTGKWVIPPHYDGATPFSEGLAAAMLKGRWGYIDTAGRWIIPPQFSMAYPFINGYAIISVNNKWGITDRHGTLAIQTRWYGITNICDDVMATKDETDRWQLVNVKDHSISRYTYADVKDFSGGRAPAATDNWLYGYISATGAWLIQPNYKDAQPFSEGLAAVQAADGHWGFIDMQGTMVVPATLPSSGIFRNGLAMIDTMLEHWYIDRTGRVVLRCSKY